MVRKKKPPPPPPPVVVTGRLLTSVGHLPITSTGAYIAYQANV